MHNKYNIFCLIVPLQIFAGCSGSIPKKIRTEKDIHKEGRFRELKQKGDHEFEKMHWIGWGNSIRIYNEALKIRDSEQVREKDAIRVAPPCDQIQVLLFIRLRSAQKSRNPAIRNRSEIKGH